MFLVLIVIKKDPTRYWQINPFRELPLAGMASVLPSKAERKTLKQHPLLPPPQVSNAEDQPLTLGGPASG